MTQTLDPAPKDAGVRTPRRPSRRKGGRSRRPVRRFMIVSHRWLSLVLGLVLLAITVSGSILLYRPEIERMQASDAYDVSGKAPTTELVEARQTVLDAHPKFEASSVWAEHGVFLVTDYETGWTVDPGTGKILGHVGKSPTWLQWMDNLHECFLSCEDYPGTIGVLVKEVPGTAWLGFDGAKVTWGGLVLGVFALILLYLSLTGIWLWFPRPSKWRSSMNVRWKRGRFPRDTDLHKVAGMIAIPFLVMWALTGASYEFKFVEKAWYAATPGSHREYAEAVSKKSKAPDITPEEAVASAKQLYPDAKLVNFELPAKDDATAAYTMYFADGFDPYGETTYPGDLGVYVDRHTGVAKGFYGTPGESVSQSLYDGWNYPVHAGYIVNGWWRLIWLVFGLSPLLLAWTGVSTWLVRLSAKRARKKSTRAGDAPPPMPGGLAEELVEDPEMDPKLARAGDEPAAT
jgi:uncharacterized iron-regulated membrane protein